MKKHRKESAGFLLELSTLKVLLIGILAQVPVTASVTVVDMLNKQ